MDYTNPNEDMYRYRAYEAERLAAEEARRRAIEEAAELHEREEIRMTRNDSVVTEAMLAKELANFKGELYKSLVAECLTTLGSCVIKCLNENESFDYTRDSAIIGQLFTSWVNEQSVHELDRKMNKTNILSTFNCACTNTTNAVCEKARCKIENGCTDKEDIFRIEDEDKKNFYDELDAVNADELIYTIRDRVADANQEFLDDYVKDKIEIKGIMKDTNDIINTLKDTSAVPATGDDSSTDPNDPFAVNNPPEEPAYTGPAASPEEVEEGYVSRATSRIHSIMNKKTCPLFESMVIGLSKSAYSNKVLNEEFVTEGTHLDTDGIRNRAGVMYTFLECLNTSKLQNMTTEYLEEALKDINNIQ